MQRWVANILAPHECLNCKVEGDVVCEVCLPEFLDSSRIPPRCYSCHVLSDNSKTCRKCRRAKPLSHVWVGITNNGVATKLIHTMKFNPDRSVALILAAWLDNSMSHIVADIVVPAPTSKQRVRQRGFDHTLLLAQEFAKLRSLPHLSALERSGVSRQVGASRAVRQHQLKGAYTVTNKAVENKRVLLIDDVTTTGATLEEAARTLRAGGAKSVDALVFAQTI